jgi:hypothetical protein
MPKGPQGQKRPADVAAPRKPGFAFDKIMTGLEDALRHVQGDVSAAKIHKRTDPAGVPSKA